MKDIARTGQWSSASRSMGMGSCGWIRETVYFRVYQILLLDNAGSTDAPAAAGFGPACSRRQHVGMRWLQLLAADVWHPLCNTQER